jgi:mRNA interferase YafQ
LDLLEDVVDKLLAGELLPQENKDHSLKGNWQDYREYHISSDWLLVYFKDDTMLVLTATRTGTHADIFNK